MSSLSSDNSQLSLSAFSPGATQSVSGISGLVGNMDTTQGTTSTSDTSSTGPAASTHISKQSQLLSKLQQLQQDPATFKQVVTDITTKLQAAAQSATAIRKRFLPIWPPSFKTPKAEIFPVFSLRLSRPIAQRRSIRLPPL